jgi:Flp pilus assembly protein TadG
MSRPRARGRRNSGRAAAAVELVLMLPMLSFVCLVAIDYSRLFYAWATLADVARDGALYASDSSFATSTTYATAQQAALADASNLSPAPTITSTSGVDAGGNSYVQVTATYQFQTIANYPGIPNSVSLSRSLRMVVTPP